MSQEIAVLTQEVNDLKQLVLTAKANRLNDSLFSKELSPHYMQLASQLAKSSMVPKAYQGKPQDLFVAMAMGYQVGLSVEQAIQCIAVINGRPAMWGDDMLALCMAHVDFDDILEEPMLEGSTVIGYRCTIKRKGRSPTVSIFTMDMAKRAKLLAKAGPWQDYPVRMLQLRARGFGLRDSFPDALKGIKSREEIEDYIEGEFKASESKPSSRTEQLKQDYLNKLGATHDSESNMASNNHMDDLAHEEAEADAGAARDREVVVNPDEAIPPQSQTCTNSQVEDIKRLIEETAFSDARLAKALEFYEVDAIEELSEDLAAHFILQLNK